MPSMLCCLRATAVAPTADAPVAEVWTGASTKVLKGEDIFNFADFRCGSTRVPIARGSLNPSACGASAPGLFPTCVPSAPQTHVRECASRHVRCRRVSFHFRCTRCNRAALRVRARIAYPAGIDARVRPCSHCSRLAVAASDRAESPPLVAAIRLRPSRRTH